MKHIVIEGPDGGGKTTLARRLCHELGYAYHHEGPPPAGVTPLAHYAGLLVNATRPTVFDRLHLGEQVYGPLFRGAPGLSERDVRLLNRLIRGQGTAVIVCRPAWESTVRATEGRTEMFSTTQRRAAYDRWARLPLHQHANVSEHAFDGLIGFPGVPRYDALPDGVVGAPTARVLLIGEQPNGALDLPFFGAGHSSAYLDECLQAANDDIYPSTNHVFEGRLALTNALTADGRARDLAFIVSQMPHLEVVAPLGVVAKAQCARQAIPGFVKVTPLPHPQYRKRFHLPRTDEYVAMFRELFA